MFSKSFVVLALSATALANVFVTAPTAASTFQAGQDSTVRWNDDSKAPALKDFGPSRISIYVGNAQQQTFLQEIAPSLDVSTVNEITFKPDASIGPDGNEYFVRFESLGFKDAGAPQFPALAFSAKYTMSGMTGVFSKEIQDQIEGQSTAPLAGNPAQQTPSGSAPSGSAPSGSTPPAATKTPATSPSANQANAQPSASDIPEENAAAGLGASSGLVMAGAAIVAALAFF